MSKNVLFLLGVLFVTACAHQPAHIQPEVVVINEADSVSFEGRGAGAGVMLMSSMGPAGIAVGVAIDVGIGKDIDKGIQDSGRVFSELLSRKLNTGCAAINGIALSEKPVVIIEKYGFRVAKGDSDSVVGWFTLRLNAENSDSFTYPKDIPVEVNTIPKAQFGVVKSDGNAAVQLWSDSLEALCVSDESS